MSEAISNFIGNDYIATLIMSIIPLIELKGGIVFAWDRLGFIISFLLAYAGSTLVFFFLFWLLIPILNLLKKIKFFNKFATKVESYFQGKADETLDKQNSSENKKGISEKFKKQLGVFIFVAIPLPMTGVWTGTAIAVFLGLKFKDAILPVVIGNFIAGLLICGLSALCGVIGISLDLVLYVLFGLAIIFLIVFILKVALKKTSTELDKGLESVEEEK